MIDTKKLQDWYRQNKRNLPWRNTTDPYKIWLSEIILQQTRVAQGLPYYEAFIQNYPTVADLAVADEQAVLKVWQGLGYYSRARNLHYTARDIVQNYQGKFPDNYKDLLKLKGVGTYTAAAVASFCYQEPVAVVDGNVYRVLARFYGLDVPINTTQGKKIFAGLAQKILDRKHPALHNQAIMEFGALHCTPAQPACSNCPLSVQCVAYQTGTVAKLPVKLPKIKVKKRYLHYFVIENKEQLLLQKRQGKGIWQNLYELPLLETNQARKLKPAELGVFLKDLHIDKFIINQPEVIIHKLTHQHLHIHFWHIKVAGNLPAGILKRDLHQYPMPIVIANFLDNNIL